MSQQSLRQASVRGATSTTHTHERFLDRIEYEPNSGCWLWAGATTTAGYGQFSAGRPVLAHRYSYAFYRGEIPSGYCVCHKCDVPECVNPDHLFTGTHKENAWDKVKKGRAKGNSGVGNHLSVLDDERADWARKAIAYGMGYQHVADVFGVAASTIRKIVTGETWRRS